MPHTRIASSRPITTMVRFEPGSNGQKVNILSTRSFDHESKPLVKPENVLNTPLPLKLALMNHNVNILSRKNKLPKIIEKKLKDSVFVGR